MDVLANIGAITFSIGVIWLAITAFQKGNIYWSISILLFHPIAGLIFCIVKKTGWLQYCVLLLGMILFSTGMYFNSASQI